MNIQLTLANAAASAAERKWRDHKPYCPPCCSAQRSRKPDLMCGAGARLYGDMKACQAELAEERRLAKLPMPGQQELFPELAS